MTAHGRARDEWTERQWRRRISEWQTGGPGGRFVTDAA
jgi:hypothetical protein